MVKVWDIFVRFSHWAVALGFFVAYLTEDDLLTLHVWAGSCRLSVARQYPKNTGNA